MFESIFRKYNWDDVKSSIYNKTERDVEHALQSTYCDLEDFKALISPAAAPYLEQMALLSRHRTLERFGKTMQLFIPMYLSNECQNICTYCGFSLDNKIPRKTLSGIEIMNEIELIKQMGFDHILLVTGEANKQVGMDYFKSALELIKPHFSHISMEVQPLSTQQYCSLKEWGVHSVLVYQETYHEKAYKRYHPKGKKSNFLYRLATPDRLGEADIRKMGIGALLGLEDWRVDSFFTALHLDYLEKKYWQSTFSLSFPRLRPHVGGSIPNVHVSDRELVQLMCAYRLFNQELDLSLSTRESEIFRDHAIKLGVTSMSAGSKTNPGGYAQEADSLEQFEISDERSVKEICDVLSANSYEPLMKNWETSYI